MNKNIKYGAVKYLFAMAALTPIAKPAVAKNKHAEDLPSVGEYTLAFDAGFQHLLPSRIINSQINGTDLEGFNPGFFVEIGTFNWSGQHGKSNYEYHIGFTGRLDYHNFHSRAYNIKDIQNLNYITGEPLKYVDPSEYGCAHVQDVINTLNVYTGLGWYGVTFDVNTGIGWHFDNHGNFGPVVVMGGGIGYRFNKNVKMSAKWRLNMFPFENLGSKTHLPTTPGIRNSIEIGVMYKLNALYKSQQNKSARIRNNNGRNR